MEYYSHTNNKILIGHFPGQTKLENIDLINELKERMFSIPNNIDILSIITKDCITSSPLHYQLEKNGYTYINPLEDRVMIWQRYKKVYFVLEALKRSTKEYSLILDGNDVVILSDLTDIVKRFNTYDKKIIFNSTIWMYPHIIVDNVPNRGDYGEYCYLNAGCAFGKTSDLIEFYELVIQEIEKHSNHNKVDSEQYYVRKVFDKCQDTVFFDYDCKIFQCWHKAEYEHTTEDNVEKCILR